MGVLWGVVGYNGSVVGYDGSDLYKPLFFLGIDTIVSKLTTAVHVQCTLYNVYTIQCVYCTL